MAVIEDRDFPKYLIFLLITSLFPIVDTKAFVKNAIGENYIRANR